MGCVYKRVIICLVVIYACMGCSKDTPAEGDGDADTMINATAYIESDLAFADIGFYPHINPKTGNENPRDFTDPAWVKSLFDDGSSLASFDRGVSNHKKYLPKGRYYIVIRIAADPFKQMNGTFTYKLVDTRNGPSMDNVMQFDRTNKPNEYQEWTDKYND